MPELPEVETIVRDLRKRVTGRSVAAVHVIKADILAPDLSVDRLARTLTGRLITRIDRRGKNILIEFAPARAESSNVSAETSARDRAANSEAYLLINLGMTGRVVVSDAPAATALEHVAARLELDDGHEILYDDVRRFGRIELHSPESWAERERHLGIEPLSDAFTADRLHDLTQRSRTPVRNWLLDQRRVAGIGNIYANEALFRAGIRPDRPANSLDSADAARLRQALRDVLTDAIRARGTTFSDFRDARGEAGGFEPRLEVYGREGKPCVKCGRPIERIVFGNRSAFLCPRCQR